MAVACCCYSYYPEDCYYRSFPNLASLDWDNSQSSINTNQPTALGNPTDSSNTTTHQKTPTVCYKYPHCSIYHWYSYDFQTLSHILKSMYVKIFVWRILMNSTCK